MYCFCKRLVRFSILHIQNFGLVIYKSLNEEIDNYINQFQLTWFNLC